MNNNEEKILNEEVAALKEETNVISSLDRDVNLAAHNLSDRISKNTWVISVSILLAGALIGGGLMLGLKGPSGQLAGGPIQKEVNIKDVNIKNSPYIGSRNAQLTMAYWSDFQCPYCKAVEVGGIPQIPIEPSIPTLIKDYVETGKLKIVFKDYAFLGKDSTTAAQYSRAIWALYPERYYAWREAMMKAQDEEGDQGFGNATSIDRLILGIPGIDGDKVRENLAANIAKYDAEIKTDQQEGTAFGVQGTPAFIIGKQFVDGAHPLSKFREVIESQLK